MKVKSESEVAQSCLTLRNPMDCSPSGSSTHEISQAGVLEWGAIAFSVLQYGEVVENLSANAGDIRDAGSVPGSGRSSGGGNGYLFWYSCLESSMDRGGL